MEKPRVDCGVGEFVCPRLVWEGRFWGRNGRALAPRWDLEGERGSRVRPFPGKIPSFLATQKRGEGDGGRAGKVLFSGGTAHPPLSNFARENKCSYVHSQP